MEQKITLILGTRREGAYSQKVAKHIAKIAGEYFNVTFVDPHEEEYKIENDHQVTKAYKKAISEAEGFILVYPEYNHSFPGTLKSLLDGGFGEYTLKPFMLVGVSDGKWGGVRATEALLPILKAFGAYPLQKDVYVTEVDKKVDAQGLLTDQELIDTITKRLGQLEELINKFNSIRK